MNQEHDPLPTAEDGNREVVRAARRAFLAWWATNPVHGADEDALGEMRATAWAGWKQAALAAQAVPAADAVRVDDAMVERGARGVWEMVPRGVPWEQATVCRDDWLRVSRAVLTAALPASAPAAPVSEAKGASGVNDVVALLEEMQTDRTVVLRFSDAARERIRNAVSSLTGYLSGLETLAHRITGDEGEDDALVVLQRYAEQHEAALAAQAVPAADAVLADANTVIQFGTCHEHSSQDELHRYVEARDRLLDVIHKRRASAPAAPDALALVDRWRKLAADCERDAERIGKGESVANEMMRDAAQYRQCADALARVLAAPAAPVSEAEALAQTPMVDRSWGGQEPAYRMDAYYFDFAHTGLDAIDRILSAVACAGKAFHHTEQWTEEALPREHLRGETPVDWIYNAACDAAKTMRDLAATPKGQEPSNAEEGNHGDR